MQKDTKGAYPHAARDLFISGAVDMPGPNNYVRDFEAPAVFGDHFILFDFREAIGVTPELGMFFNRAGLIEYPPPRLP